MVIKMYFRLNTECFFIRGKKCGAIFDLIMNKIYALNQKETQILTLAEKNEPIRIDEEFLNELMRLRLGNFYLNKTYIQKLRLGSPQEMPGLPPKLHRAFLEINNSCNRDCWFCGYYGIRRSLGCLGCNKWNENGKALDIEKWKELIDGLKDLDCIDIYITGGDLTLSWKKTIGVLDYAYGKFNKIYLTLNQQSISSEKISDLNGRADLIIQSQELDNLNSNRFPTLSIVSPEEWKCEDSTRIKNIFNDYVIKDGNSYSKDLPMMSKEKFSSFNMHKFLNNFEHHPCLGQTLSICCNGNVIPCPMMRNHSFGNVKTEELYSIFERRMGDIDKFWKLNLDKIEKCSGCEFRYVCADCRALEEELTGKIDGKMLCSYDPIKGTWL